MKQKLSKLLVQIADKTLANIDGDISLAQVHDLIEPRRHSPVIQRRRAALIVSRARIVAGVFSILTPIWIAIDMYLFAWPQWGYLAALRITASIAFGTLALWYKGGDGIRHAWTALGWLLSVPTLFFIASHPMVNEFDPTSAAAAIAAGYAFLPFVMCAGLSVFPITAIEGVVFATPLLLAHLTAGVYGSAIFPFNSYLGAMWLLLLLSSVATLAAMSQLHFLMALVSQSSHDKLTGAYARRIGEEMLNLQFGNARRNQRPLSLVFIDLDDFKKVNDRFGHEGGDRVLRDAAQALLTGLRQGDLVIRWGGEEFLVVMPDTDTPGALSALRRLRSFGLGMRPDGKPQTASIGVAEALAEDPLTADHLVEIADHRMYVAKQAGKDRVCSGEQASIEEKLEALEAV
ncbi:diguanylate cyclase [Skermanella stibiiresistens SB22]|uniref:diguanylate cyclase n=1 Tax=Skermanella stibiiresistens SB22 TaxID=1385369 RepID=W9H4U4_9PROT|nr:GGDEF domain-containing protein [Skermanella stibiiresistens]EWY38778.1 diguanylate cyclase [Skermanella stibiiresistens SB22]